MDSPPSIEAAFLAYRCSREPAALAQVYDLASARLLSVAMHLTKSPATAEDVVQDTFLLALENPDRWDETKPLMPWLLGILSNRVRQVDGLSRRSIDPARLLVPDSTDPQEDSEATELLAHVDDAITHLPQPYRGVVLLRLRNGLSPADISIALGRNPNTVRTQLARGIEMLRKLLPTSVAVLLATTLSASQGLAGARALVLQRATEIQCSARASYRAALLRKAVLALTGVAAATLLAWNLWLTVPDAPPVAPAMADQVASEPEPKAAAAPATTDVAPSTITTEREELAALGSAAITILVRGSGIVSATVELEPLGDRPLLFVHNYAFPSRHWRVIEPAKPLARDHWRRGVSTANGQCTFDNLAPGYWACRALGVTEIFRVVPDARSNVRVTAPANTTIVQGVVLTADGQPLAEAPIWKLNRRVQISSQLITHSDAQGRFAAALPPHATLGAFHPGFAPVAVTVSPKIWQQRRNVVLQFVEPGASVAGRVLTATGEPCVGAVVQVGNASDLAVGGARRESKVLARVHRTVTDIEGRYRFESLVPGHTVLRARCKHHGLTQQTIHLVAEQRSDCELQLPAQSTLTGQIRTPTGAPAAGVRVRVGALQALGHSSTITDAEGRYALPGVCAGRFTVAASDLRGGFACRDIHMLPGDQQVWDAQLLPENLTIAGRVVDARGQPFQQGWLVYHHGQGFEVHQLGPDARFSVQVSERNAEANGSLQVYGQDPRDERGVPVGDVQAVLNGVRADARQHEIRVPDLVTSCSMHGRVVMPDGDAAIGLHLLVGSQDRRTWRVQLEMQPDGSFDVQGLEPGTYQLRLDAANGRSFGPIELKPNQRCDLGEVRVATEALARPEFVRRFALLFPDRTIGTDAVTVEVRDKNGWIVNRKVQASTVQDAPNVSMTLPEGEFSIHATSSTGLVAHGNLLIDANTPARRSVLLEFQQP